MVEKIDIRARWDARKESAAECAKRMLGCLQRLATIDEVFAVGWLKCGDSLQEALQNRVRVSQEFLEAVFEQRRSRREAERGPIDDLGIGSGRFWNGLEPDAAHISVRCGAYVDPAKMPGINEVRIGLPQAGAAGDRLLRPEKLREIVTVVAEEWDPDWARVSTFHMDEILYPARRYRGQEAGWLTYISSRYGGLPPLPKSCQVIPVSGRGDIIVITPIQKISAAHSSDVILLRELSSVLEKAGFLSKVVQRVHGTDSATGVS
jgi:hypothetical protein